jgi:hypothetical protein
LSSPKARTSLDSGDGKGSVKGATAFNMKVGPQPLSGLELEVERQAYLNQVCSETTRFDVRDWLAKTFTMLNSAQFNPGRYGVKEQPSKRGKRARLKSDSVASDSGLSGQTGLTGTTGTALRTVGGSIAAPNGKAPASQGGISAESLVVHHNLVDEPLSVKERIQAFLEHRIPELDAHVNEHVQDLMCDLQREVDEDLAEQFLDQAQKHRVFDAAANALRWQNARHQALQKRLNSQMPKWVLEAIDDWDQKKVLEKRENEISDTDLIFEYLTKRAAHIDSGKLPSEIPVIKTMYPSYSLPKMWRDKYLGGKF